MKSAAVAAVAAAFFLSLVAGAAAGGAPRGRPGVAPRSTAVVRPPVVRAPVGLDARAVWQSGRLAHARYVCRRGAGATRRFACRSRVWLERELGETARALEAREVRRAEVDWPAAVKLADRVFPGSAGWLLSCSSARSEGGWGRFVWNGGLVVSEASRVDARAVDPGRYRDGLRVSIVVGGSGAGGWLQFLRGTFYRNADRAFDEAAAGGLAVPVVLRSWFSRVGQAVVGASMLRHGQRGEWAGSGC